MASTSEHMNTFSPISRFLSYQFATDTQYQQGLAGILGSGVLERKNEEEKNEILMRSEVFYFNRMTGLSISVDDVREARRHTGGSQTFSSGSDLPATNSVAPGPHVGEEEPQTLSFAQLKELIEQGRTDEIPNNKKIPDILSSEAPSESKTQARRKPWELDATA
ncbi:hypothetical protein C8Q80DRAFT_82449 [Daedaleopsis nitida]|nr:hypothetical protein C8Q80DRAFT_82449 [Daedaleopsis nitida]